MPTRDDLKRMGASEDVRRLNPDLAGILGHVPGDLNEYYGKKDDSPRRSKYGNVRTECNGRTFASGKEAKRAQELETMQKAGEIFCLQYQVKFPVSATINYIADFVYLDNKLNPHIEDSKGFKTDVYKLKKKLFKEKYGREIEEV